MNGVEREKNQSFSEAEKQSDFAIFLSKRKKKSKNIHSKVIEQ
ncbi:hypothetical protein [Paranoxybacillus vitaminiphilus]|nr:hypothetical protein [Anoxybacillus vitaminiphilus]